MNKYAIAVLDFFDNENQVFIVETETESEAIIEGLMKFNGEDNNAKEWYASMKGKTTEEILKECFDGDMSVSKPVLIK